MSQIIRQLFRGDLQLLQRPFSPNSRESVAFDVVEQRMKAIKQQISSEFHPLLEHYQSSMMSLMDAACEAEFLSGYRLGVRMMLAVWPEDQNET